ncbi:MAG: HepT-like ribonuclease domain-containing protein [Candidatus Dormibacteria bacterium]
MAVADAFDRVTPMRAILASFVAALIIVHGLVPRFTIDGMTIALLGLLAVLVLAPLLQSASFMGGKVEFKEVERLAERARALREETLRLPGVRVVRARAGSVPKFVVPESESEPVVKSLEGHAHVETLLEGEPASPNSIEGEPIVGHTTYADILAQAHGSPKLALLRLTGELEAATSRLLTRHGRPPTRSLLASTQVLVRAEILPPAAAEAMRQFSAVRNRVAHGDFSTDEELVIATVDIGLSILNTIELVESSPLPGPESGG